MIRSIRDVRTCALFGATLFWSLAAQAAKQTVYYWTGNAGDGKWSTVGNWSTDEAGKKTATVYPGQNGFSKTKYDSAHFPGTAAVNVVLDVDVTVYRCMFGTKTGVSYMPLTLSGPGHTLAMESGAGSSTRSYNYRETHLQNITISATTWDLRAATYFESGATVNVSDDLSLWNGSSSVVYIKEGADVTIAESNSYGNQPTIVVDGGRLTGGTLAASTLRTTYVPHKLIVNGGTVSLAVKGNVKNQSLASDITVNGGTVVLDTLTLYGASVFRMTGGDVSIRHDCSAETQFLITGGEKLTWLNGEPWRYSDYCDISVPPVDEIVGSSVPAYSNCMFVNTLTIPSNTTYRWSSTVPVRKLKMGANAKLVIAAADGGLAADAFDLHDTATIEAEMPDSLTDEVHPILVCGPMAADVTARVTVTGTVPSGWEVRGKNGCVYLWKDALWNPAGRSESPLWTGASSKNNNLGEKTNWKGNNIYQTKNPRYYGGDLLSIRNNSKDQRITWGQHVFLSVAGPSLLTGLRWKFSNSKWGVDTCNFNLHASLPLTFQADVNHASERAQFASYGTSYIVFNGNFSAEGLAADFGVVGHVKFAADNDIGLGLRMVQNESPATWTIAEVLSGVRLTVKNQRDYPGDSFSEEYYQLYNQKKCLLQVDEGASLTYENAEGARFGWLDVGTTNRIYGSLDVKCPLTGRGPEAYFGPGRFHLASTASTNGNFSIQLGGGIRFLADEFLTADSAWPQYARKLEIVGDAVLEATNSWRYAVEDGLTATSDATDRMLTIATNAVLTIASTNGFPIVFGETIGGAGTLRFEENARVDFARSFKINRSTWTTVATVKEIVGLPTSGCYKYRVIENADKSQSLQCRVKVGIIVYVLDEETESAAL